MPDSGSARSLFLLGHKWRTITSKGHDGLGPSTGSACTMHMAEGWVWDGVAPSGKKRFWSVITGKFLKTCFQNPAFWYHKYEKVGLCWWPTVFSQPVILILNIKKTYQFTTPCKSDKVTHPKQHKSFFSGIMWQNDLIALTIHLTWPRLSFALPHYHASKETDIKQTLQRL